MNEVTTHKQWIETKSEVSPTRCNSSLLHLSLKSVNEEYSFFKP